MVVLFSTVASLASLFQDGCNFAVVSGPIVQQLHPTFTNQALPYLELGIAAYREPELQQQPPGTAEQQQQQQQQQPPPPPVNGGNKNSTDFTTPSWIGAGGGACTEYPQEQLFDTVWKSAQAFAFLALVLGGGGTIFAWCSTCFVFSRVTWRWTGYELILASICQGLVYLWFQTQMCSWNTCSMSYGAKSDLLAVTLWFVSGIMVLCRYPMPLRELVAANDYDEEHPEQVEQHHDLELVEPKIVIEEQGSGQHTTEEEEEEEQEPRFPHAVIS